LPKGIKNKEKHTVVQPFNLRIYCENFTYANSFYQIKKIKMLIIKEKIKQRLKTTPNFYKKN